MTIEVALVISALSLAFGIYSGISNMKRNSRNDTKADATQLTTVIVKLEKIGDDIKEIKSDMRDLKDDIQSQLDSIVSGATTAETVIFTLPVGYRPRVSEKFFGVSSNAICVIDVCETGNVAIKTGANAGWLSLSGISFRAT